MGNAQDRGRIWYGLVGALAGFIAIGVTPSLHAADTESSDTQLVEIVVTAQRRSENLQNVPLSAQVIGNAELSERNYNDLQDLSQVTPSLHVSAGGATSDIYIRGIGSGNSQSFDQSVGTFIDDVYFGRARSSTDTFFDVNRIEVLKGPQSTFFGNNAIAGALNIVTNKPSDTFDASARALYGMFGQYAVESAVGLPINNAFSLRVAGIIDGQEGWMTNINTGLHEPEEYNTAGRAQLAFKPNEDFDALVKVDASRDRQRGDLALQWVNCPPSAPFTTGAFCASALARNVPTYIVGNLGDEEADAAGGGTFLSSDGTALTMNYRRFGQTFTSVTGYYHYNYNQNLDLGSQPSGAATTAAPEQYYQVSQEFRVASPVNGPIEYLAGAYFQTDHLDYQQYTNYPFFDGPIEGTPPFAPLIPYLPISQGFIFSQPEHIYSGFGSVSWNISDTWKATAGLRGTSDEKTYDRTVAYGTGTQAFGGFVPLPASVETLPAHILGTLPGSQSGSRKDHSWMPSANLQYQMDPKAMLYASYSRAFKAGGFNGSDTTGVASNIPFAPEYVNAYELGFKSQWLDDHLLFNLDVFRSNYRDLQVVVEEGYSTGNGVAVVRNAAQARSQGVEYEGQWVASQYFRLLADVTYLDSYYVSYPNAAPSALQIAEGLSAQNLSGASTEYAPKWSGTVTARFSATLPGDYRLTADLSPFFTSAYFLLASEDVPQGRQSDYVRLDARLTLETPDRHWAFDLIGKNLNNREILNFSTIAPTSTGSYFVGKDAGANVAVQARYHW
jgi:outer membrane receptor protein involved in Fe transport